LALLDGEASPIEIRWPEIEMAPHTLEGGAPKRQKM